MLSVFEARPMKKTHLTTLLTVVLVWLAWSSVLNQSHCSQVSAASNVTNNFESSYKLTIQNGYYLSDHTLHVSLPPSVEEYYEKKPQVIRSEGDYAKLITPAAVQSIAENLRNISRDSPYSDEEFANAVLMIVHQIQYVVSDAKYPVEALVDNKADCDGLSILAASLMKAGGLDVVLLLYDAILPAHMNVGVSLQQMPVSRSWWTAPSSIEFNNKTYWIAECTPLAEWTVGSQPRFLSNQKPKVIPTTNCEKNSPAKVSSSLDSSLQPSSISINLAAEYAKTNDSTRIVNVSGSIFPPLANETIALYLHQPGSAPENFETLTDDFGNYTLPWNTSAPGTFIMKTSWSGSLSYSGSDSENLTVFIGPERPKMEELSNAILKGYSLSYQDQPYLPWYVAQSRKGVGEFFKENLTETDIVFSGDFVVLSDGHEKTPNVTTITIPAHLESYHSPGSRRTIAKLVPEKTMTISDAELLNSQFGFMLHQNGASNYTASVKILNAADLSQITHSLDTKRAVYINASEFVAKNYWHKVIAKVSAAEVAVDLHDENGISLHSKSQSKCDEDLDELGVVMTYPAGQIIAFKNLKVNGLPQDPPTNPQNFAQPSGFEILYPYVRISLLLAGAILAVACLKERRAGAHTRVDWGGFEPPTS
jgi:hypothetical protein